MMDVKCTWLEKEWNIYDCAKCAFGSALAAKKPLFADSYKPQRKVEEIQYYSFKVNSEIENYLQKVCNCFHCVTGYTTKAVCIQKQILLTWTDYKKAMEMEGFRGP